MSMSSSCRSQHNNALFVLGSRSWQRQSRGMKRVYGFAGSFLPEGRSRRYGYEKREGRNYEDADHRTGCYAH